MKRLPFLFLIFTLGACASFEAVLEEKVMLKESQTMKIRNVRKPEVWTSELRATKLEAELRFAELLDDDYTIYDMVTESGFANLAGKSPGKYVCVWRDGDPTGEYALQAAYVSPHTAVEIMGIRINSYNRMTKCMLVTSIAFADTGSDENFSEKLTMSYGEWVLETDFISSYTYIKGLTLTKSIIETSSSVTKMKTPIIITDCYFRIDGSFRIFVDSNNLTMNNCMINVEIGGGYYSYFSFHFDTGAGNKSISNCWFNNLSRSMPMSPWGLTFIIADTDMTFTMQNCLIQNSKVKIDNYPLKSDGVCYLYTDQFSIYSGQLANYILLPGNPDRQEFIEGKDTLDLSAIQNLSNYTEVDMTVVQERRSTRGVYGTIKRVYYNVQFPEGLEFPDSSKFFDDNDLLLLYREEEDAILANDSGGARKINNNKLYENNGTTLFSYRNDENFLIIAEDGDSNETVFAYYKGELRPTVFANVWEDTEYTIKFCYQIWRTPTEVSLRNMENWTDSPLSGNVLYQDMTSVVVIP